MDRAFNRLEQSSAWWRTLRTALWFVPLVHIGYPKLVMRLSPASHTALPAPVRRTGQILTVLGGSLTAWSVWTLVRVGQGTPAPYDPPRVLVCSGPYRFCRNPMELGNLLAMLGRAIASGSLPLAIASFLFAASVHGWVVWHEEPALRQKFGVQYETYARHVPRWGWLAPY